MKNNSYTVAMLGAGNIGSAVIDRLENLDNELVNINLKSVLVSDISKERSFNNDLLTDNFKDILNDDSIDLVIEVLGGVKPGKEYIKSLLSNGKAVTKMFTPENSISSNEWYYYDLQQIQTFFNIKINEKFFIKNMSNYAENFLIPSSQNHNFSNNHLQYAITWFLMSFSFLIIFIIYLFRKKK